MEVARYRLLKDKIEGTWSMRGGNALKNGRMKSINYYPGSDSIFEEDNRDTSIKARSVVFRYNDTLSDPAVEVIVPIADRNLIDYLEAHPFNGRFYKRHDPEQVAEQKLENYDNIEKALDYIKESDDTKIKGIALAVLGIEYLGYSSVQLKMLLKEKALKEPLYVIGSFEAEDYQNRYLVGLSYASGVIKSNATHTAVVWSDNDGEIIRVAKGENPIDKLTEFFEKQNQDSEVVLQELGLRLKDMLDKAVSENTERILELHQKYIEKTGKNVPLRFRNNIEWLNNAINN